MAHAIQRTLQYERKLTCLGQKKKKGKLKHPAVPGTGAPVINGETRVILCDRYCRDIPSPYDALVPVINSEIRLILCDRYCRDIPSPYDEWDTIPLYTK